MLESLRTSFHSSAERVRRTGRRRSIAFRRWAESTDNLIHISILLLLPLLIGAVTMLSESAATLGLLLFPPLASGTYTLFADPEGPYSSPRRFVGGMTLGAACGWIALEISARLIRHQPAGHLKISAISAALGLLLTGVSTWALDVELPTAYSTSLLVLITGGAGASHGWSFPSVSGLSELDYVISIAFSTTIIASVFVVWRRHVYERRAQFLYGTTQRDDHVLVPMRGRTATTTAVFAARLAAAHEAGKVVLLDVVDNDQLAAAKRELLAGSEVDPEVAGIEQAMVDRSESASEGESSAVEENDDETIRRATAESASKLETQAERIRNDIGVPCEVVVAAGDPGETTIRTAEATNCDLIVAPYEEESELPSSYVQALFNGPLDTVALRPISDAERWSRILVAVTNAGDAAHAMIDFASRLAGQRGSVSVCTCIRHEDDRRSAESRLANLVETTNCHVETRVARSDVTGFIEANAGAYDLVVLGSGDERSAASRFISPPAFERLREVNCDLAVVDRGNL